MLLSSQLTSSPACPWTRGCIVFLAALCTEVAFTAAGPLDSGLKSENQPPSLLSKVPTVPWRSWECVPGVIRDNGEDSFRLEIKLTSPTTRVVVDSVSPRLIPPAPVPFNLRDDGQDGDRVAGDRIFTSGPFLYNSGSAMASTYWNDADSPAGLDALDVCTLSVLSADGTWSGFLLNPSVGVLDSDTLPVASRELAPGVIGTDHLVNVISEGSTTQWFLRALISDVSDLTTKLYTGVPDACDFVVFFSTQKAEHEARLVANNFDSGREASVRVPFSGTGRLPFNESVLYGSRGRLQGLVVLDAYNRGIYTGNAVHELLHHWSAYIDPSLGLTDGSRHYKSRTSVGSILGGQVWIPDGPGSFILDCDEGVNGAHHAAPLDKYMMGLIEASAVPPMYIYSSSLPPRSRCDQVITDIARTVTLSQIQALHGVRAPGPAQAQRNFRLMFVAESANRALTPVELTYYSILAEHLVKPVPEGQPDPYVGFNWVPMTRYFGEGTTWRGDVPRFFDMDGDLDVDQSDFGLFQVCLTGPDRGPVGVACDAADWDRDTDVDGDDAAMFQECTNGTNQPPGC